MSKLARRFLRVTLVLLLLGTVLAQVLVPVSASEEAAVFPELDQVTFPYSVAGILVIACAQVALLVLWRLLSMVSSGAIFTRRALRCLDVIMACGAVAAVLTAGVMFHLLAFVGVGGPAVVFGLAICVVGGLAFLLLMVVLRGLLESAIANRTELDEVI